MRRRRTVVLALGVTALATIGRPSPAATEAAAADPAFTFPASAPVGATITIPAPCPLDATDELLIELDPLFSTPRYFLVRVPGPAALGAPVAVDLPNQEDNVGYQVAGAYQVRASCEHLLGPDATTTVDNVYARFAPRPFAMTAPAAGSTTTSATVAPSPAAAPAPPPPATPVHTRPTFTG